MTIDSPIDLARRAFCASAATTACLPGAFAQPAPPPAPNGRPLGIVVPYAAGGAADPVVRPLAQRLQERLNRPVIVDNRPGANGVIGVQYMLRQPADGNTILYHITSLVQALALSRGKPPYDFNQDIAPLTLLGRQSVVLVVPGRARTATWQTWFARPRRSPRSSLTAPMARDRPRTSTARRCAPRSVWTCRTWRSRAPPRCCRR